MFAKQQTKEMGRAMGSLFPRRFIHAKLRAAGPTYATTRVPIGYVTDCLLPSGVSRVRTRVRRLVSKDKWLKFVPLAHARFSRWFKVSVGKPSIPEGTCQRNGTFWYHQQMSNT